MVFPDMVLLSGGGDGGTITHVVELAEIIKTANPKPRLGMNFKLPIIYAGNNKAQDKIKETLKDSTKKPFSSKRFIFPEPAITSSLKFKVIF